MTKPSIIPAMIHAIIFDFDGLIFDSETPDFISWQETYGAHGVELSRELWNAHIGTITFDPYLHLEELLGRPIDRDAVWAKRKARDNELLAAQTIMPGVEDYLAEVRELGLKFAIASSSKHSWVDRHLKRLGLFEQFDLIFCSDDVGNVGKPDPAVYQAAIAALGIAPQNGLALEDSPNGVTAAKGAGLWCTAVPNRMTRDLNFDHADYRLNALTDMPLSQLITEVMNGTS
ncbi:HAD family hydrolase [Candidatus Leptofilum sp.]|uniref:HAD family hydrolase n=1 Tax=Candidatus Leptofilum sp. TaxID=3241576 RepID=UPI003B5D0328